MPAELADYQRRADAEEEQYLSTGDAAALDKAVAAWTRLLDHPAFSTAPKSFHLQVHNSAGVVFQRRYQAGGSVDDLNRALDLWREAIKAAPPDSSELPAILSNLGIGLRARFARNGKEEDLAESIQVYRRALQATIPYSPDLPGFLNNLGNSLSDRFALTGHEEDLEEAIQVYRQAVQTADASDLPGYLNNLGNGLRDRFALTGRDEDLEEAITVYQEAVEATPQKSANLSSCLNNLGNGWSDQFQRSGRLADLEEAIRVLRKAVLATPPNSPELPSCLNNLGIGLRTRFVRIGTDGDLDEAIQMYQQALQATPWDSPHLPAVFNNLGIGMLDRFERTGREADLEEAIRVLQQAVGLTPPDSTYLPAILTALGSGLADRFERTRRETDIEEAILVDRQAVQATSPDSPALAGRLTNLGLSLSARFGRTRREEDLEEAIKVYRQAMQATPLDSPNMPRYFNNLGNGLCDRFGETGQEADLEEAIRIYRRAVHGRPPDSPDLPGYLHNLGNSLRDRFRQTEQKVDREEAIRVYRRACELGMRFAPQIALDVARSWGRWAAQGEQWAETVEAYGFGLATGRQLLARQLQRAHKESWLGDLQGMSAPAAYALAKLSRYEDAAVVMESGRARLLAEAFQRQRSDLEQLPDLGHRELYQHYLEVVKTQDELTQRAARRGQPESSHGPSRLEAIVASSSAFDRVVAHIRQLPGYEDFLADPTFHQIKAAALDIPLVYLFATTTGGLALVVHDSEVQAVWLDALKDITVLEWLRGSVDDSVMRGWLGAYRSFLIEGTQLAQEAWFAVVEHVTRGLWTHIMDPVAAALRQLPIGPSAAAGVTPLVTLIPAGLLALLPLHAAWTEDPSTSTGRRFFLDEFTVNYAPSALALGHARDGAEDTSADHLLAVDEPLVATASRLLNAHAEVTTIAELFSSPVIIRGAQATRQAVHDALPQAQVVHFSGHGTNNWQYPLESGLLMGDDQSGKHALLTVRDILESKQTRRRLATLSACETGIVGMNLPDEVIALPCALLQAGFRGVAASLWSVSDISTAMLMQHFYRSWREDKLSPAQALRAAQQWLRDTTNQEKANHFLRDNPKLSGRRPDGGVGDFFTYVTSRDPDARDFEHPFWWAAFYLTGV